MSINLLTLVESVVSTVLLAWIASYTSVFRRGLRLSHSLVRKANVSRCLPESFVSRTRKQRATVPPVEVVVQQAQHKNDINGHGNLGYLSLEAAFSPPSPPITQLPESHTAWDRVAEELPSLIKTQSVQESIKKLPTLEADTAHLDDQYLQRAATILGILSHAYVRLEGDMSLTEKVQSHSEVLPHSLYRPWTQVCKRLGRSDAFLTYVDLVLFNYKTTAVAPEFMNLDNSGLLVPTVDNKEEHTFYGVMIELNGRMIPIFRNVIRAHRSVLMDDRDGLKSILEQIARQIKGMTTTLGKLNANKFRKNGIDPVIWTKTVANLAIPWLAGVTGSAGTAHPFFHMIDEFIERDHYESKIGQEALRVRRDFPVHWQQFLKAIRKVSVNNYISSTNDPGLTQSWQSVKQVYIGDEGMLGFHRRKVYGFLSVSFRIGRGSTINGLGQRQARQKWEEADDELEKSRTERLTGSARFHTGDIPTRRTKQYSVAELILHNTPRNGVWFSAQGKVYDATPFLAAHPGGERVIGLVGGQDATRDLAAVAHLTPAMLKVLERYQIGTLRRKRFESLDIANVHSALEELAFKVAEIETTYAAATSFLDKQMTSSDLPEELNAHKQRHYKESQIQLCDCHVSTLLLQIRQVVKPLAVVGAIRQESIPAIENMFDQKLEARTQHIPDAGQSFSWQAASERIQQNSNVLTNMKKECCKVLTEVEELDQTTRSMSTDTGTLVKSRLKGVVGQVSLLTL